MLRWLQRSDPTTATAAALYATIVEQARRPAFYASLGVPDSYEGRFELLALHMALTLDRLSTEGPAGHLLGRALNEVFVTDMDDNMREIGIGDLTVPKKVKKAAAAVFDRASSLRAALTEPTDEALQAVLATTIHLHGSTTAQSSADDADLARLALYVRAAASGLKPQSVLTGALAFPAPDAAR